MSVNYPKPTRSDGWASAFEGAVVLMLDQWHLRFPGCEPVAHLMRITFGDRWVRFHSLPESKRYPENEDEYSIALERHNRVLGGLTEPGRPVVLLTTGYSDMPERARRQSELQSLDPDGVPWRSVPMHDLEPGGFGDPTWWHVYASVWGWEPRAFDAVVRLVADDVVANVMIVATDCRWLLHPYDGGMDVIAESSVARDHLKSLYPGWLSPFPSGM